MKNRRMIDWRLRLALVASLVLLLTLFFAGPTHSPVPKAEAVQSVDRTMAAVHGAQLEACTATAVASTNVNRSGPYTAGAMYLVYGYTSATDFTGIGIKCIQGPSSVTVASVEGRKISAGEKQVLTFRTGNLYISCQTGSGSGYYDVCRLD